MPVISSRDYLQRRYDDAKAKFEATHVDPNDLKHPAARAWLEEKRRLDRLGFELPKDGLYIVAAFAEKPRNILQSLGRDLYYRNPRRFHVLLPCLGKLCPSRPGHAGPGMWKPPTADR